MKHKPLSIRTRLVSGALLVLLVFLAAAGWAVQQAHADSVRTQRFARLQSTIYLLMAGAELDATGALMMPQTLAEPRLSLPASGLYANIAQLDRGQEWQSLSTLGLQLPFQRTQVTGQWRFETLQAPAALQGAAAQPVGRAFLAATYAVKWSVNERTAPLVFCVLEDQAGFDQELKTFAYTLWLWLGGAGVLLLLTQTLLLRWGLSPLAQVAQEVADVEAGVKNRLEGHYPKEIAGLSDNLNTLMAQERARQTRYKEALDDLAHSLKTPLAVMRATLDQPAELPAMVAQQVARMDDIVVHQLGRAAASGATRFAPPLALAPVLNRIRGTLDKVYADKALTFTLECPADLAWRMDQGDAFELLGNVLDNAAKWARQQVGARCWLDGKRLCLQVTDDGPGFADTQAALQRRVRLDESVPGHGIGLAVVSNLVASYQGTLRLSRAVTGGAQVDVVLGDG